MVRDAAEQLGVCFTRKEIDLMKQAHGCQGREELVQRLADPPRPFRPTTNMNKTGKMTALRLTYEDAPQFSCGQPKARKKQIQTAYAANKKMLNVINGDQETNTFINHPNKSQEILRKKLAP